MLPMAGLFLPETLHRRDRPTTGEAEKDNARPHFFQRTSLRPDGEAREARLSTTSFADMRPSSEDVADFASSATAFQFADFVLTSGKASSESRDLAHLIDRVRQDVAEASRLYLSPTVLNFLEAWPDKRLWIDTIRLDVQRALNDIGDYVADTKDGESYGLKRKMEWLSRQHKKITVKQQLLSTCHHSLITAIGVMQTAELCGANNGAWQDPIYEAPVNPWVKPDDTEVLRGPYSRRETRISQKNLSLSSMYLPQTEQEITETHSVNSTPVELPGSTVEDLAMSRESIVSMSRRPQNSYRHSSARRAYFRNSTNDIREHMTTTAALSENSSPLAELEHTQLQAPPLSTTTRRSFDSSPTEDLNTQTQTYQAYHPSLRRSSDFAQSLPTLNERTIERNDSTMSTTAVVAVSQVAKRYQANPVYIRKSRDRHQSLPTALPHLHNHSSLTDDLADYMIHLSPHSDQIPSVEWDASSDVASPSISIVSCPAVTQPGQVKEDEPQTKIEQTPEAGSGEVDAATVHSPRPSDDTLAIVPEADTGTQPSPSTHYHEALQGNREPTERAPSIRSMSSVIAPSTHSVSDVVSRKPLPATATVTFPPTSATMTPSTSSNSTPTLGPPATIANQELEFSNVEAEIDDAPELTEALPPTNSPPTEPSPTETNASSSSASSFPTLHGDDIPLRLLQQRLHDDQIPLRLLQQRLLHQTYVPDFSLPPPMANMSAATNADISSPPATTAEPSTTDRTGIVSLSTEASKPQSTSPVELPVPSRALPPPIPNKPAEYQTPASQSTAPVPPPVLDKFAELDSNAIAPTLEVAAPETTLPASLVVGKAPDTNKVAPLGKTTSSEETTTPAKPMSAQAKRRAAHQRRMELAFGGN